MDNICFHCSKCTHKYKHTLALNFLLKYSQKLDSKEYHLGCRNPYSLEIDLFTTIMSSSVFQKGRNGCWLGRISVAKFSPQQTTDFYKMNLFGFPTELYVFLFQCFFITFIFRWVFWYCLLFSYNEVHRYNMG